MPVHAERPTVCPVKTLVVLGVLAVIGTTAVVLVNHFGWGALTGKAWAITYEVTTEPAATSPMQIEYLENPDRYRRKPAQMVTKALPVPFTHVVVINAGQKAEISAMPNAEQVLTCRILLDGVKVLAEATAAPGHKVSCETVTGT